MALPAPPRRAGGSIDQHGGRRIFSERIEEGTVNPNNVHENTFGHKSFNPQQRLVSETYNSAHHAIHSAFQSSELSLYQCRLYKEVAQTDREGWDPNHDFFINLKNAFTT